MANTLFISWVRHHGRSEILAQALDAKPIFIAVGRSGTPVSAPLRYLAQSVRTAVTLVRERPRAVVCMAPPNTLVVIVLAWRVLLRGRRAVIDAHSDAVIHRRSPTTRTPFRWLAARADGVIVTNFSLAQRLVGASTFVIDNPPREVALAGGGRSDRPLVVMPSSWGFDEPLSAVLDAAKRVPEVRVAITGKPVAGRLADTLPDNVELTGFLSDRSYQQLLQQADVVLALTTRSETMQQAAYEALDRQIPIVASDSSVLRDLLGRAAVYAENTGPALAAAIRSACEDEEYLRVQLASVQAGRLHRQQDALVAVRALLCGQA